MARGAVIGTDSGGDGACMAGEMAALTLGGALEPSVETPSMMAAFTSEHQARVAL